MSGTPSTSPALPAQPAAPAADAAVAPARAAGAADAGPVPSDAGRAREPTLDAGTRPRPTSPRPCAPARVFELCWHLGAPGQSCNEACREHGGFDPRAAQYVGNSSQGGSLRECSLVLEVLGRPEPAMWSQRSDLGLGCHIWDDIPYWLDDSSPALSPLASVAGEPVRIACACAR